MSVNPREQIASLPAYRPGKSAPIKLASNENPNAPLPSVIEAIAIAAGSINRYPDNGASALVDALCDKYDVKPEQVAYGCGSVTVCEQIIQGYAGDGDNVVHAWRSFEAYPLITEIVGVGAHRIPLRDHTHDLDAMLAAIDDRTRVVIVCNPNNPTGTAVTEAELTRFLDAVPPHVLVVLDEAYTEYVSDGSVPDGVKLMRGRPNVCVLRTFSKAYGLAGLRVGYLIAEDPAVAETVRKTMMPFSVSSIAQAAAVASLEADDELRERVSETVAERERVTAALRNVGYEIPDSHANFVWLPLGDQTDDLAARLAAVGIMGRPFSGEGIRVTIGSREENDALIGALTP